MPAPLPVQLALQGDLTTALGAGDLPERRIGRVQLMNGSVTELTKTEASTRDIPISPLLRTMLLRWHQVCPFMDEEDRRVFPCLGSLICRTHKKRGTPLSYANFTGTYWKPTFRALGLPYVTPHSARHAIGKHIIAKTGNIAAVQRQLGHRQAAYAMQYARTNGACVRCC